MMKTSKKATKAPDAKKKSKDEEKQVTASVSSFKKLSQFVSNLVAMEYQVTDNNSPERIKSGEVNKKIFEEKMKPKMAKLLHHSAS